MTETLLELIDRLPARGRLEAWWTAAVAQLDAHGLPSSALPVFAVWLALRSRRPVLALVNDPEGSFQEAGAWFREDVRTVVFPAVETLPFDRLAPDEETVRRRLEAVDALGSGEPVVCFSSWAAMTRPALAADALRRWSFTLTPAQTYSLDDLLHRLVEIRRELGLTILMVEQSAAIALEIADYCYVMENGEIVLDGSAERLRKHQDVQEFYLGGKSGERRSYRDIKQYRRRRRWYG